MQELLLATGNPGKFREITEVLKGLAFRLVFLGDLGVDASDFVEDGASFKENAYKKAKYFFDKTGLLTLAEDSGVLVDALPGELGVKTRRWGAGQDSSDEEWIDYFLERMKDEKNRNAKFSCCACFYDGNMEEYFEGETRGIITEGLKAPILPGLPLSSCFVPEGFEKVYAALTAEEKNTVSHRGKALHKARRFLAER